MSWQVIFIPHVLVIVAWLLLCHLQIGHSETDSERAESFTAAAAEPTDAPYLADSSRPAA